MKWYRKVLQLIMKAEITFGALLVISIVVVMCIQVVMRYIVGMPFIWAQELTMMFFIWATMIGASVALKTSEHIVIESFMQFLPKRVSRVIMVITSLAVLGIFIFLIRYLPRSIEIQNRSYTSSLPINIPRGYLYSVPAYIAVLMMILTQVYFIIYQVMELLGRSVPKDIAIGKKDIESFEEQV